ncbi:ricin-type beta-trefoil lectin domain protein [Streptomyces pseudovenezuelae]|uniref:ricin-type beta-trefoil lectin domain protein n=1 Tax=Streptomyces pseudovenezuelae TaxID=67350 RepID=UPI0036F027E0
MLATLAVRPDLAGLLAGDASTRSSDRPDDWFDTTTDEQLRFDQCLMADAVRLGGPGMYGLAQDALNQTPERLRELAAMDGAFDGPLRQAHEKDESAWKANWERLLANRNAWEKPLDGLTTPHGFNESTFHHVPGVHDGEDFYDQTGLGKWAGGPNWNEEFNFYDPTPEADGKTVQAVKDLGTPLYGEKPYDPSLPAGERDRQYYEQLAFEAMFDPFHGKGADDARLFLASGGFPRTAPEPGTVEYRIAVEDMKTRFASCGWRDPIDPNRTLRQVEDTATQEWQQEIASQAAQRNQILTANRDATTALTKGAESMADLLGQSWIADHLARWQDYWSPGGLGWIGDSPAVIQVEAAQGKCLDVAGAKKTDGTPVQLYTCNNTEGQQWQLEASGDAYALINVNSQKCLDVQSSNPANGTKIQIWTCNGSKAQQWNFDVRAAGELRNVVTDKCLDLHTFDNSQDSWLWTCNGSNPQKFRIVPKGHKGADSQGYPDKAQFDKAKAGITAAQTQAKKQLDSIKAQLTTAKKAATASDTAEQASYRIADASGTPRGRGLLVGQQKAQVTKGAVAGLEALAKAAETAEAATRASAGDSKTIAQRALAQAAQSKAEFRRAAAAAAEAQAKAAADAAKLHRDNAKKDKETAEAKLAETLKAEGDAKAAAADAHAKRLAAEAEEKTAKAEKEAAAAKQAEANQHKVNAQAEAANAQNSKEKAEAAEKTAVARKNDAVTARDNAKAKRDDAWEAEQKADAARAKADAKDAYADSLDAGDAATAARAAADEADRHASDAEAAAGRARTEADAATQAAAAADAAATRAEAAAKRSRAAADAAQAAKLKADAAVRTATSATADAIAAARDAASEARTAVQLAAEAGAQARTAKSQADAAKVELAKAMAASAKAAGFAHVTAQAAVDADKAAAQVAEPANDAIQLGSPFVDTDSAASLVVLTGQASKSIAEQQKAVADAHAKNAQAEADAAKSLADQAKDDTKAAYQHAANAAGYARDARGYAKEALGYAAGAAEAAAKATQSLARTTEYDRQATEDAAAADASAGRAEGYATSARASADQAALDAEAAHAAAAEAEQAAKDARAAADRADAAATEAEEAAKDADRYAKEAQEAAERAERQDNADQIETGTVPDETGALIGGMFYVVDHIEKAGEPDVTKKTDGCDGWWDKLFYDGDCTMTTKIHFKAVLDLYMCSAQDLDLSQYKCPSGATKYLGQYPTKEMTTEVTHTITIAEYQKNIDPIDILFGSWIKCAQKVTPGGAGGSWSGCAWAAVDVASLFAGKILRPIADAVRAVDAAARTGIGFADAFKALRALPLADDVVLALGVKGLDELVTTCTRVRAPLPMARTAVAAGGCPEALILYNSEEMSQWAYKYRVKSGFFEGDHNIAVAKVKGWGDPITGDFVIASSSFAGHSETKILDMLKARNIDPSEISALYTERQPCPACASELSGALKPGTPITYSVPYHPDFADAARELLDRYVRQAGGRSLARRATSDQRTEEQAAHD